MESDIDQRSGWPDELCVVLREFPRDTWADTRSPMARFWIDKHNYLRRQADALKNANDELRSARVDPRHFGGWLAPRLQGFLAELHGHHQIEDYHYFPAFRSAEPRLDTGFDVLARDHDLIHQGIAAVVETINTFLQTLNGESSDSSAQRHAADRYMEAISQLHDRLYRHLADEEDLIIPLMIRQDENG